MVGGGERVTRLAGELCDGWLTYLPGGVYNDSDGLRQTIDTIKEVAVAHGRDPEKFVFNAQVVLALAETDDEAWVYARHACQS